MKLHRRLFTWIISFVLFCGVTTFMPAAGSPLSPTDCVDLLQDLGSDNYTQNSDVMLCAGASPLSDDIHLFLPYVVWGPKVTQAPEFEPMNAWVNTIFTLRWNAVGAASTYVLEVDTDSNFPHPTTVYEGEDTSWTSTWQPGNIYHYRVRGLNELGAGPWSGALWISYEGVFPKADAGIASGDSGTNFGSLDFISVGYYSTGCPYGAPVAPYINRALFAFDTAGVPAGLNFDRAELTFYLVEICFLSYLDGTERTITAYRVTSPWSEGEVTWNNAPGIQESVGSIDIIISKESVGEYQGIDITSLVREWLNGSKPNYGVLLRTIESGAGFTFYTRESGSHESHLSILFDAADTADVQAQLDRIPPGEQQCVVTAPGELWCALQAK